MSNTNVLLNGMYKWIIFKKNNATRCYLKGCSSASLIHVLTHCDTEYDPPPWEIKFADR